MTATIGKPYSKYKDYAESYHVAGTRPEDSQWRGKLASTLGYSGSIHQFAYDLASEGKDSYGRQLRKFQKNSRPAICDLTLNAPKSLSVEALVHSNPIAIAAHDQGVESALAFTEEHLLFSQIKRQGQVERFHTNKALIGSFRQRDNREGEPHLHTHNVIFNVGYVQGKWRSLANEQVYLGKLTVGAIYQNDTAYHLHQAGYKTYWDANGQFELAGNPKQLLTQTFAQRTEKLEAYLAAMGLDRTSATPEQLNAANRATRNQKAYDKDADSQLSDWQATAATVGIAPCPQVSLQELESFFPAANHPTSPQEIVIAAAERLSEKTSAFGYMDLIKEGCRISSGRYVSSSIQYAIDNSQELVGVPSTTPYPSYTTRTILQRERQILDWAVQGKSFFVAICDVEQAIVAAEKFTLNPDQTKALQHIAISQDVVILIQGSAGVGKTRALCALKDLMGERALIGCAVGGLQAEGLEAESGIASQTIESLIHTSKADFPQNALIVVDEAGVVSNRQMHSLLERARESNCRLLLVGDTKQLSSVEQGNPFRLLQTRGGLETAFISQNMRQKDEQLLAVVDLCAAQQPQAAFDLLDKGGLITEIPDVDALRGAIAQDYLTRPIEQRRNTLIMATTHKERATLTAAIRSRLIEQGELTGASSALEVLQKKDLDKHHLLLADHYQVGDRVRFFCNCGSFTKGELYRVTATNPEARSVELVDANRQTHTLDLAKYRQRQVFSPHRIEIAAGEEMRFTAGIKDTNGKQLQVNGQRFRVEKVDPQKQTIEISTKGKRFTLAPENLLHSDYRWISTVHSLQGATAQYAILATLEGNGALLSQESWYVAASRAKLEFAAYCTDKAKLRESILISKAQRPAMDLIYSSPITPILEPERQPTDELAFAAIKDHVEVQTLETSSLGQNLADLIEQLSLLQNQEVARAIQQLTSAINRVVVIPQTTQLADQQVNEQAIAAISSYLEQTALESALTQPLTDLTQQIEQLTAQLSSPIEQLDRKQQPINEQAIEVISSYLEQTALESVLTQPLTKLTRQVTRLTAQLSNPTQQLDVEQEQIRQQAIDAIAFYIEEAAITAALTQPLTDLKRQVTRQIAQLSNPIKQLDSAINKFTQDVANYQALQPTGADEQSAEPIAETVTGSGEFTECESFSVPSLQLLAAQLQILTDQIFAPNAVYQEQGLRIERRQGKIRASINGELVNLRHPENLATIVNRLQNLVNEFELLSLYEEFEQAGKLEQAIANLATEIVQLNCGNYSHPGLSVAASDRSMEIQLDQKVVFKSEHGFVTRPDNLMQLSHLQLQLASTVTQLQQTIAAQLQQEQATIEAERLKAQSKLARTSSNTPPTKERDRGFTL